MLGVNSPRTFDWANIPLQEGMLGNSLDAFFTLNLYNKFREDLAKEKVFTLLNSVIVPASEILTESEYEGMDIDTVELKNLDAEINKMLDGVKQKISEHKEVGDKNLNSTKDMIEILYTGEDGFKLYPPDRTGKDAPSVAAGTIELLLSIIKSELSKRK